MCYPEIRIAIPQIVTYMSISSILRLLQDAGTIFPYRPALTRQRARRRLFLTTKAESDRTDPGSATNLLCGSGFVHATLDRWVLGGRVYGGKRGRYLADLVPPPPDIWEIRVTEPSVQARLFGRFPEPDTLILTGFHTRNLLGPKDSRAWADAMADCVRQWDAFNPALPVFQAASIHAYVTENCDEFPIKAGLSGRARRGRPRGRAPS